MPTQLGQLYYSLGLDSSNFDSKIKELAQGLNGKLAGNFKLDTSTIDKAIQDVAKLQTSLKDLQGQVTLNVSGIPKTSNIDITANLTNTDSIRTQIEAALQGVTVRDVQVDTASAKKAFNAQIWNVKVTTDRNHIQELVNKIKTIMGVNKISVKVTPDWSRMDMARLQKTLQNAIGNIPLKNIKVYVDRKYIQDQLNKMNFTATVDIKVNKASAQQAVQGAINSAQNLNNGGGGGNGGNSTTEIIRTQNKALTDQLGIRRSINDQMSRNTQLATMLGNAMGNVFGAYMIKNFLENLIQIGGEIQKQRLALGHIIDSATNANLLFEQMKQLAVKSPFGLLDLMQNARQLSAFGVEYNNLYDTMKRLSDMAAGLGIQFSRLALAYGETKERGFLDGKLVRQFSYMGLPVLQKVAEYYTQIDKLQNGGVVTASQVRSMVSDKQVSFEDVDAVIKKMTEEGGQFYNMQEVMAESVAGKWKNLRDAIDIMYSDIVDGNSAILKAPATILTSLAKNYDQLVAVLTMVAARLGMTAAQNAIGTAVLSRNTQALVLNSKAQKEAMATAIQKIGTYKKLTAAEAEQLATISAMNNAQLRQFIVDKQLTKGELERLIMMKQLTNEQKQYIIQLGLMTENEVKTAAGMTRIGMAARTVGTAIKSMFTGWNVAFLTLTAAWSIYEYIDNLEEKYKQFTDDMAQSTKDFEKATADIASEVNGLDFDSMSVGERTTEIKAMVEYIKDEVPGAAQILEEIFKTDSKGKFVNDTRARYDALKAVVEQMDELSHTDLTVFETELRKLFMGFDNIESAKSVVKLKGTLLDLINQSLTKMPAESRDALFTAFKNVYKDRIAEALKLDNLDDVEKVNNDKIKSLVLSNKDMLSKFLDMGGMNSIKLGFFQNYTEQYNKLLDESFRTAMFLKQKMEMTTPDIDWTKDKYKNEWNRVVEQTIKLEYKDEPSEAQEMLKRIMEDPTFFASLNIKKGETYDAFVERVLREDSITKNLYLNVIPMFDGKVTQDAFADWMNGVTGKVKTEGTVLDKRDTAKEQLETAYIALKEAKTLSKLYSQVKSTTGIKDEKSQVVWKAIDDTNEKVVEYANNLTQFETLYDNAYYAATNFGLDTAKIIAEAEKKFNKSENGSSKKEDTVLKEFKERVDNFKKAYSEFQKWSAKVGKEKAGQKLGELGLLGGMDVKDLASPEAYLNRIKKLIEEWKGKVGNDVNRKKELNALLQLQADVELNITDESIKRATEKVQREINDAAKQYDLWKSWFEATGDKDLALKMSVSVQPVWDMQSKGLLNQLMNELQGRGIDYTTFMKGRWNKDAVQSDVQKQFQNADAGELYNKYKAIYDLIWKSGEDANKKMANIFKSSTDYMSKLNVATAEYKTSIEAAMGAYGEGTEEYNKAVDEITRQFNSKKGKILTDSIKDSLNWDMVFGNLSNVSKDALNEIENMLMNVAKNSKDIDATNLKALYELIDKVRNAKVSKDGLFAGLNDAMKSLNSSKDALKGLQEVGKVGELADALTKLNNVKKGGDMMTYFALLSDKKKFKLSVNGKEEIMTLKEYLDALAQAEVNVANGASIMQKSMQEFAKRMTTMSNIVKNTLSAFGMDNSITSGILSSFNGINTAVSNIDFSKPFFGGGIDNVLNNMDQMSTIASNVASMVDTFKQAQKDAAKKQNEYYDSMRNVLVDISNQIISRLEKSMDTAKSNEDLYKAVLQIRSEYNSQVKGVVDAVNEKLWNTSYRDYSESNSVPESYKWGGGKHTVGYYLDQGGYGYENWTDIAEQMNAIFGTAFNGFSSILADATLEQLYYLQTHYSKALAQNTDISDAVKQIIELKEKEDELAKSSSFLGSTWDDFRNSFISACQDMNASASDLANNIYEDINNAVVKAMINAKFSDELKGIFDDIDAYNASGTGIDATEMADIKRRTDALTQRVAEMKSQMQSEGLLYDTENNSSASSSIKNVSEETADVLAALVQGIRLDTSKQVELLQRIADNVAPSVGTEAIPEESEANVNLRRMAAKICGDEGSVEDEGTNLIAQAQLTQLQQIASHTLRNAEAAEAMRETLDAVVNGTKSLSIQ